MTSISANQNNINSSEKTVVIMLGPPGSGKGTQAVKLTREVGIPHISTGDLFRENIANGTELGKQAKTYMDAGKLVPDQLVLDMLFDRISRVDCANGFLLDGSPRTVPQAEALDNKIEGKAKLIVINLSASDALIEKRIEGRRTCKSCAEIFNIYFSPPKIQGQCDRCQGELYQRPDDSAAVVQERLRVYNAQTKPLISHYTDKGVLVTIDGESPPETVYQHLIKVYKKQG
ncbi:MAG: adenylate kinase [Parachlamydiaceae bacterium]|nr:adenylate kinase [Parachlamydiaceae bacterium]